MYNLNRDHQDNIIITNLYDIPYIYKLSQEIIFQKKFHFVEKLDAWNNRNIQNINHIKETLKELDCGLNCGIDQNGINELKLVKLNASHNKKIKNVNHMKETLKELGCQCDCGIDQDGINQLKLIKLDALL